MTITEVNMDLFDVPQGYYLAYCMTADLTLGVGLAKKFDEVYNMKAKILDDLCYVPDCLDDAYVGRAIVIDNVFNLVLKKNIYKKAKYKKLRKCLQDMKDTMKTYMITKVAIPQLGCGHEGLEWDRVREIIEEVFDDTDVEILVCTL